MNETTENHQFKMRDDMIVRNDIHGDGTADMSTR